jgi:hypothetical protein
MCCAESENRRRQEKANITLLSGRPANLPGFPDWRIVVSSRNGKGRGREYYWNPETGAKQVI